MIGITKCFYTETTMNVRWKLKLRRNTNYIGLPHTLNLDIYIGIDNNTHVPHKMHRHYVCDIINYRPVYLVVHRKLFQAKHYYKACTKIIRYDTNERKRFLLQDMIYRNCSYKQWAAEQVQMK